MISQIENHTNNLETMVEERTLELKESREKYRDLSIFLHSILDSATEYAIMAVDFYGNILEFNKGAEKLFGWKEEEVLHKENISITILQEDQKRGFQKEMSKRAQEEGVCEQDMERIRKNGDRFPAISVVTALRDTSGNVTGFLEIVRDLTRRKALERELRETKEFLENIMESSVDPIVTTDLQGKITYLNRACEELFQYRKEELLGEHISKVYVRGIQEAKDIMATLQREEKYQNYEMEARAKDGAAYTILNSIFMVRDVDGAVVGTAGIFKNITDQKRLEGELKQAQVRLVEASRMRALGELVAGVAHELNNPLMASQTILHVISRNLHEECPNQERLELVRKCNDRIEKIVEHLREFSRQKEPLFQELDINEPIKNALLITGQQLLNHSIVIVKDLQDDLPEILGDTNQLEQVFLNLIANARDAMDDVKGPKELQIRSYLSNETEKASVVASIKDSGTGIPAEIRNKIFDPFFSTKPVGKGTGLGLSLCFSIIEAHAGRIEIKSSEGSGTEVLVYIPLGKKKE
jgi:PAS domain S-box-containing protein